MRLHIGDGIDINVDAMLNRPQGSRLRRLHELLAQRHRKGGASDADADGRAQTEVEDLVAAAFGDLERAYVGTKSKSIDQLVDLQTETMAFYDSLLTQQGDPNMSGLESLFREMEIHFDELRKPAAKVLEGADNPQSRAAALAKMETEKLPERLEHVTVSDRFKTLPPKENWTVKGNVATRDYNGGTVELREVDGLFEVTVTERGGTVHRFKEFDVAHKRYDDLPLSSEVVQAHHGCQNKMMEELFGDFGYRQGDPPTIWLRDSTSGSPHGIITHHLQKKNLAAFRDDPDPNYGKIRDVAVAELKAANVPEAKIREYLRAMDEYFDKHVAPNIPAVDRAGLMGVRKAYY